MAVDKNLFLYDLALVATIKNEGHYIKEWLDYHLLAGVNHFYIYDHESSDDTKEILQPYVDSGLVTYIWYPDKDRMYVAYNDAVKKYKFFCRYMTFIDSDEFILPKDNRSIVEVVDEVFNDNSMIGGMEINWQMFGSNFQEKADYSRGVLERFTRRAANIKSSVKSVTNPRKINYLHTAHYAAYFYGIHHINAITLPHFSNGNYEMQVKIVINHYHMKSLEEYVEKNLRGKEASYGWKNPYPKSNFNHDENNDVFDDSILKYRDARRKVLNAITGGGVSF